MGQIASKGQYITDIKYYHQFSVAFEYRLSGNPTGSPTAPNAYYYHFGKVETVRVAG